MEKIKKSFRGYNKKAVHALLEQMSQQYENDRVEFSEQNGKLKDELYRAGEKIKELKKKLDDLSSEKDYVANAIVEAEKQAAKIIAMAHVRAQEITEETTRSLKTEREKAQKIRESVMEAMKSYQTQLDEVDLAD